MSLSMSKEAAVTFLSTAVSQSVGGQQLSISPYHQTPEMDIKRLDVLSRTGQRIKMHMHMHAQTNKQTRCAYVEGPPVWEKPVFLIQPQQGIKSTLLCMFVCDGRVCWLLHCSLNRSLDTKGRRIPPPSHRCQTHYRLAIFMVIWSMVVSPLKYVLHVCTCVSSSRVAWNCS